MTNKLTCEHIIKAVAKKSTHAGFGSTLLTKDYKQAVQGWTEDLLAHAHSIFTMQNMLRHNVSQLQGHS